ncbi:lycopene cyclase domain-containing protein [Mucilaginibacter sp. RB4R14]|uniref:lycopene cyclase domain-containing protein n=1 Tax=Mucilaginibacter aurantiaciroseus TaxID=2949308 RepID=UPI002091D8B9|nr:lycopene cyclase domain-containing protein [Mucilaginibacter aurantiaciroseus]MCO5935299.1 lycopene cyclase domain-containing protein [Mucilaginibacter aurantiaciroseus]
MHIKFTYLFIDFFTILFPLCFSFHSRFGFVKIWPVFLPSLVITSIFFISNDILFTSLKIWGFNFKYVMGPTFVNLPIEEVLFFFCIPYACVFTFHCLDILYFNARTPYNDRLLTPIFIVFLIALAIIYYNKTYPLFAFTLLIVLLSIAKYVLKVRWLVRFYITYALLLFPFFVVNGLLTGTGLNEPVVWYNKSTYTGLRISTIPVEDMFYGMALILMNIIIYTVMSQNKKNLNSKSLST